MGISIIANKILSNVILTFVKPVVMKAILV